jgi:hypothetical protein
MIRLKSSSIKNRYETLLESYIVFELHTKVPDRLCKTFVTTRYYLVIAESFQILYKTIQYFHDHLIYKGQSRIRRGGNFSL